MKLSSPDIGQEEIDAVVAVMKSGVLSMGPKVEEFEARFAEYIGVKHAVAVSSGTAGLHLAMLAAGVRPGDEVITTPFSFISSANCIEYVGARPVFADIDPETYNIDPEKIFEKLSKKTMAIFLVHIFGRPCEMERIESVARIYGLAVIEDACEAVGAEIDGVRVGSFSDMSVFAFYPNKAMTTGEGGMICTDSDEKAALMRSWRNQGRDPGPWLVHPRMGYNYRMAEIPAAIGCEQLKKLPGFLRRRQIIADEYGKQLRDLPAIKTLYSLDGTKMSWFVFVVQLPESVDRDRVMARMEADGIPTRAYFSPIHLQKYYREKYGYKPGDFPVCERVAKSTLALPFHNNLTDVEISQVVASLKKAIK